MRASDLIIERNALMKAVTWAKRGTLSPALRDCTHVLTLCAARTGLLVVCAVLQSCGRPAETKGLCLG